MNFYSLVNIYGIYKEILANFRPNILEHGS